MNEKIKIRIAIYSRKSKYTDKGDSVGNQIELAKEYIKRNYPEDIYDVEIVIYEDEGFSGGSLDRPRFKDFLEDERKYPYDILICYRLDRISRNIYNQLCAVSMIENAKLDCSPVNYKISKIARFFNINLTVANKLMTKQELYKKLANNDINLCVSTVDENNMIPYESLELGTPCLVGNSFKAFEGSSLQDYLVVKNADDILEIKEKTLNALENRGKILEEYKLWREKNKQDALKNLKEVLE
jgi:hypothetical protein